MAFLLILRNSFLRQISCKIGSQFKLIQGKIPLYRVYSAFPDLSASVQETFRYGVYRRGQGIGDAPWGECLEFLFTLSRALSRFTLLSNLKIRLSSDDSSDRQKNVNVLLEEFFFYLSTQIMFC